MPLPVPQEDERQKLQLIPVENAVPAIQITAAPKQQFRRPIAQQIQNEDLFLKSQPKPQARPQPKPQPQIPLVVEELEEFEDELEDELEELLEEAPSTPQQPKAQPIQQQRPQPQTRRPIDGVFVISQQEDQPDSALGHTSVAHTAFCGSARFQFSVKFYIFPLTRMMGWL